MDSIMMRIEAHANTHKNLVSRCLKRQWCGQKWRLLVLSVTISSELLELKPILLRSVMNCLNGFPVILKRLTLKDFEMPFYAKICFYCQFHQIFLLRFWRQVCENEWRYFYTVSNKNVCQGLIDWLIETPVSGDISLMRIFATVLTWPGMN